MKKIQNLTDMTFKFIASLMLVALTGLLPARAQEYSKNITRAYKIKNSTTVDIFNKYGKIHVITWDEDSVRFDIDLKIRASSDSKLNKLKSSIDFDLTGTEYYVTAKTKIGSGSTSVLSDLKDMAGTILSSGSQVTIDYIVMIPDYINLKMDNKFGDVYIDDYTGNLNLTLSNGELKANNLSGNSVINISSGDGVINSIKEGKLMVSYSDFLIKDAGKLSVDSRSSKITIEKVVFLKLQSRHDKYYLPEISELYGDSYFSDFTIHRLLSELNFNFKYGDLSIENITKAFSFISIASEYTDINLVFERGSIYDLDITHHQDVTLTYPRQLGTLETKVINEQEKQMLSYGKIGYGTARSKVKINAPKKCTVTILHK